MAKASKAEAIRKAREIRGDLARMITQLEEEGHPDSTVAMIASSVFEKSRNLERTALQVVRK